MPQNCTQAVEAFTQSTIRVHAKNLGELAGHLIDQKHCRGTIDGMLPLLEAEFSAGTIVACYAGEGASRRIIGYESKVASDNRNVPRTWTTPIPTSDETGSDADLAASKKELVDA